MKTNNYPTWLVPLNIAKELKEIGFKENCYFEFSLDNGLTLEINKREEEDTIIEIDDLLFCTNEIWQNVSVPTWEQAFEWFISKGFIGTVVCFRDASLNKPIYIFEIKDEKGYLISSSKNITKKYGEAREALVNKLIEVYENNKNN